MNKSKIKELVYNKYIEVNNSMEEEVIELWNSLIEADGTMSGESAMIFTVSMATRISVDVLSGVLEELIPQIVEGK